MTEAPDEYHDDAPDEADDESGPNDDADPVFLDDSGDHTGAEVRTGDARVDEVLAGLSDLDGLPVDEHAGVFERAHDSLRKALDPDRESA